MHLREKKMGKPGESRTSKMPHKRQYCTSFDSVKSKLSRNVNQFKSRVNSWSDWTQTYQRWRWRQSCENWETFCWKYQPGMAQQKLPLEELHWHLSFQNRKCLKYSVIRCTFDSQEERELKAQVIFLWCWNYIDRSLLWLLFFFFYLLFMLWWCFEGIKFLKLRHVALLQIQLSSWEQGRKELLTS